MLTWPGLAWPGQCYSAEACKALVVYTMWACKALVYTKWACKALVYTMWALRLGMQLQVWGLPSHGMQRKRLIGKALSRKH